MVISLPIPKVLFVILAAICFLAGGLDIRLGKHTPNWLELGLFFLTAGLFLV